MEFAKVEKEVFEGLKQGTKALQKLNDEMKIEDVEKLMDDSREALEYSDRISKILSESLTTEQDEAAMKELEELEEKLKMGDLETVKIPKEKIVTKEGSDEKTSLVSKEKVAISN